MLYKQNKSKYLLIAGLVFLFIFVTLGLTPIALAQSPDLGENYAANLELPSTTQDLRDLIINIVRYFLVFLALVAVVMIIYSGFLWMTSQGNETKIGKAKSVLKNAAIGLVIILFAFAIVTFIIGLFTNGLPGSGSGGSGQPSFGAGIGVIGNCTIESVYPEPGQQEVPRNTSMIVTFKEAMDPLSIRDASNRLITDGRVRIYKLSDDPDVPSNWITNVTVNESTDNMTYVFTPDNYLGSPSEYIWYAVYLSNDIQKVAGGNAFDTCSTDYFRWTFEVSNRLDLTPPQVNTGGIFPRPDNIADTVTSVSAVQATGNIVVNSSPAVYTAASVTNPVIASGPWSNANVSVDSNCGENGTLQVSTNSSDLSRAFLNRGAILLGTGPINNNTVTFSYCNLTLTLISGDFDDPANCDGTAGECLWDVPITAVVPGDTLIIGSTIYTFVSSGASGNEILVGGTLAQTATNIASELSSRPDVNGIAVGSTVNLTAVVAEAAGNNINLATNNTATFNITPMSGGADTGSVTSVNDEEDQPRNAVIQVNFNEAINPLTVSGNATDVVNYIAVKCISGSCSGTGFFACGSDTCVDGRFIVSNQYQTVEFVSNNQCGVNGCGEDIYCLPGNTQLRVDLQAATLEICATAADCSPKSPYNTCTGTVCQNSATGEFYPKSEVSLMDGIMDTALNSLDGDRSNDAEGPSAVLADFYNENTASGQGDSYLWSFFISDEIVLGAPEITVTTPAHVDGNASLTDAIKARFDMLLMSSSLRTGAIIIFDGISYVTHKAVNLWNFSNIPTGYWAAKQDYDTSLPLDGYSDETEVEIRHSDLSEATSYRAQLGSAVKDIYQNCYKPSVGPADASGGTCAADAANPNCCPAGAVIAPIDSTGIGTDGNCL